jgi:hypothetical protein
MPDFVTAMAIVTPFVGCLVAWYSVRWLLDRIHSVGS